MKVSSLCLLAFMTVATSVEITARSADAQGVSEAELREYYETHSEEFRRKARASLWVYFEPRLPKESDVSLLKRVAAKARSLQEKEGTGDPKTRMKSWGWIEPDALKPGFREVVFELAKIRTLSDPVTSEAGVFICWVDEREPAGLIPFEEVKERIRERLERKRKGVTDDGLPALRL